ncbi:trimeric intracellular cation channel family protein [Tistrella mobilis]
MDDILTAGTVLAALDLIGTFVFALSGAVVAVRRGLDLFGVLVLSFAAASAGGILRDLLIGAVPPAAISQPRYVLTACVAGVFTFYRHALIERFRNPVQVSDAAGLALFAVSGAQKALGAGLEPAMAALLGMLTGIGGGILRDVLVAQVPAVLKADLYAVAALAGAGVVVTAHALDLPAAPSMLAGAALCFGLRVMAIRHGWQLPVPRLPDREDRS